MSYRNVETLTLGVHHPRDGELLTEVAAKLTPPAATPSLANKQAKDNGLVRVAGNVYEHPATRDFWAVKNGQLVRLTGKSSIVDDDEHMDPADANDPEATLDSILADLEF